MHNNLSEAVHNNISLYHIQFKKTNLKIFSIFNLNNRNFHNEITENDYIFTLARLYSKQKFEYITGCKPIE